MCNGMQHHLMMNRSCLMPRKPFGFGQRRIMEEMRRLMKIGGEGGLSSFQEFCSSKFLDICQRTVTLITRSKEFQMVWSMRNPLVPGSEHCNSWQFDWDYLQPNSFSVSSFHTIKNHTCSWATMNVWETLEISDSFTAKQVYPYLFFVSWQMWVELGL